MKSNSDRIWELDFLKGLAVLGMIVYHFFYLLDFCEIAEYNLRRGGWLILARAVQITFLSCVGILMEFSWQRAQRQPDPQTYFLKRQWKRGLILLILGLLITVITSIFVPEMYVRFGILHCIGMSILLLSLFTGNKSAVLRFAIAAGILSFVALPANEFASLFYLFGWRSERTPSIDYFPLFPWSSVIAGGILLGHFLGREGQLLKPLPVQANFLIDAIAFLGKHSLLIYLLNVPLLGTLILLWGQIF